MRATNPSVASMESKHILEEEHTEESFDVSKEQR